MSLSTRLLPLRRCALATCRRHIWGRPPFGPLSDVFKEFEHQVRNMEREMSRTFRDLDRATGGWSPAFRWLRARDVPVETAEGGEKFQLQLDLADFKPEEVRVSIMGNQVSVRARSERKSSDGSNFVREFSHSVTLPDDVDPDTLRSVLNADGTLNIEGPRKHLPPPQEPKEVPIERGDSAKKD
ncbi:heat shock protein Hsp-16.1/Hsp-16.11-like [Ornithodoros turicata]|uniref:heat shock protein Hsp-16.1/Hsp-16.11-like n=1 Tax=Ornithodoros turicata TaxID=34597 RepID=UPI0031398AE9